VFEMSFTVNAMVDTSKQSMVVSPMRSPQPSPSDPRYWGGDNRELPSEGDVSVGPDGIVQGGYDFYVVNEVEPGIGRVTPDGEPLPLPASSPGRASPKSRGGFVRVE